jgi:hypothetical protein
MMEWQNASIIFEKPKKNQGKITRERQFAHG